MLDVRGEVTARVESLDRRSPQRRARVLCGAPEGQRADWMVEKLAEFGIERVVLVDCARGRWPEATTRLERLRRVAVAALRQSRRRWLMSTDAPLALAEAVARVPVEASRWLAAESGTAPPRAASEGLSVGAVGPAGGFTAEEAGLLESAGFTPMALADGRLRSETAAIAWAGWWSTGGVG
jgi:RsmE family RNA methyltransferase